MKTVFIKNFFFLLIILLIYGLVKSDFVKSSVFLSETFRKVKFNVFLLFELFHTYINYINFCTNIFQVYLFRLRRQHGRIFGCSHPPPWDHVRADQLLDSPLYQICCFQGSCCLFFNFLKIEILAHLITRVGNFSSRRARFTEKISSRATLKAKIPLVAVVFLEFLL